MKISTLLQLTVTASVVFFTPLHSLAQSKGTALDVMIEERFKAANKKGDGKLTLEEAKAGMPKVAANFDRIDTQKRGYITVEQIKAMAASQ